MRSLTLFNGFTLLHCVFVTRPLRFSKWLFSSHFFHFLSIQKKEKKIKHSLHQRQLAQRRRKKKRWYGANKECPGNSKYVKLTPYSYHNDLTLIKIYVLHCNKKEVKMFRVCKHVRARPTLHATISNDSNGATA